MLLMKFLCCTYYYLEPEGSFCVCWLSLILRLILCVVIVFSIMLKILKWCIFFSSCEPRPPLVYSQKDLIPNGVQVPVQNSVVPLITRRLKSFGPWLMSQWILSVAIDDSWSFGRFYPTFLPENLWFNFP